MTLTVVLGLAAATIGIKAAGSLLPRIPEGLARRLGGLAPALLAALVVSEVAGDDGVPNVDATLAGVMVAVAAAAARAPLPVCVVVGAAVAAGLRAAGIS